MAQDGSRKKEVPPDERRKYLRVRKEVDLSIRIVGRSQAEYSPSVRNLSIGGIHFSIAQPMSVGTKLQLRAVIKSADIEFGTTGRVVWTEYNHMTDKHDVGVSFVGMNPTQRQNIMTFIGVQQGEMEGFERRRFIRLPKRILTDYRTGRMPLKRWRVATTQDISIGGMALIVQERLDVRAKIEVRIHLDDGGKPLRLAGVVLEHIRPSAGARGFIVAVEFQPLSPQARRRLGGYISDMLTTLPREPIFDADDEDSA